MRIFVVLAFVLTGSAAFAQSGPVAPATCTTGDKFYLTLANGGVYLSCVGTDFWQPTAPPSLIYVSLGACPTGYSEVAELNGIMVRGTVAANNNVGQSGGSDTITPTVASLTAAAQTFSGAQGTTSGTSAGTPAGTNGSVSFTPTGSVAAPTFTGSSGTVSAQTISWPVGVPTFSGTQGSVPAETFTGSSATTSAVSAGTPVGTNGTVSFTPTGSVAAPTFTGTQGTVSAQTISWPVGVPTFSGTQGSVPAETFTGSSATTSAVSAGTPAGTNGTASVATVTGSKAGTSAGAFSTIGGASPGSAFTVPAETFTGSALATHTHTLTATGTNGTVNFTPAGTVAWPVGVPTNGTVNFTPQGTNTAPTFTGNSGTVPAETFTGSALGTHTHTLTAAGTNGTSTVTGTLNSFDNRSAFTKVIFCVAN